MVADIQDTIQRILRLPVDFHAIGSKSIVQLLLESGYEDCQLEITAKVLEEAIREFPTLIQAWSHYSEDQRTSEGWYFLRNENDQFEVGYYDAVNGKERQQVFSDEAEACAVFIQKEIEGIMERR